MRVARLEAITVSVPYAHPEMSSKVARAGVTNTVVKLTTDDGLVGWGECTRAADAAGIESAVRAMAPLVLGRDPWDNEALARDLWQGALWAFQPMTAAFAYAGIDMALLDLCGKAAGQPLYRLFGGAQREHVDYFYYLTWGDADSLAAQCRDGLKRGYGVFYLKVGSDEVAEEAMLEAVRGTLGPAPRLRIDANLSWSVPQAVRLLTRWHAAFDLDFVEGPVPIEPIDLMQDLKRRVSAPLCVNEGLWREADAVRVITSRCGDYLCFSPYWVGSMRRFQHLAQLSHHYGWLVCKHTHGELGLAAAAGQHMMLAAPNTALGNQQTAQVMAADILTAPVPTASSPRWGLIDAPGLGVGIDEEALGRWHEAYRRDGEYLPYGDRFTAVP